LADGALLSDLVLENGEIEERRSAAWIISGKDASWQKR
jgi:hypothetical protein